jgi:transcriptional antiterminator NusG
MENQKHWYVIHTYSGYENKVKMNLESKIHSLGMEEQIFQVLVPMQNEVDAKDDKQKVVARKVFPGYVLIEMIVDDRTWYAVRNTPGVTGFVGTGTKPIPLSDREVERILGAMPKEGEQPAAAGKTVEEPVIRMECPVGLNATVRIKAPGFTDMVGTVAEINDEQQKIKVMVEMFGRETPIEVKFTQVEAIE